MEELESTSDQWELTAVEFSRHFAYYHRITPHGELLAGARAREFFLQSKLPPQTLSRIWKLSDVDKDGRLNAAEFAIMIHLMQQALKGVPPPSSLPSPLLLCLQQAIEPQLPVADNTHMKKCRSAFSAFHENVGKGVLGGDAARYLLMKSNLSKGQLFHIWKLSDVDEDGHLTFQEFTVAMHLIFVAKLGYVLPIHLNPSAILPSSFQAIMKEVQAEAEELPEMEPVKVTLDPFSPPSSPFQDLPTAREENPFIADTFIGLSSEQFREGSFDDFQGDPFLMMDPFADSGPENDIDNANEFIENEAYSERGGREDVVIERTEPVLQQAKPVDVVGSQEDWDGETSAELESLSRASQRFLESHGRPEKAEGNGTFGMEDYRKASMKGLTGAIEEMEVMNSGDVVNGKREESVDVMSHLADLEAEILTALDDANVTFDRFDDGKQESTDDGAVQAVSRPERQGLISSPLQAVSRPERQGQGLISSPLQAVDRPERQGLISSPLQAVDRPERQGLISSPLQAVDRPERQGLISSPLQAVDRPERQGQGLTSSSPLQAVDRSERQGLTSSSEKPSVSLRQKGKKMDLDDYLGNELASLNDMFAEFQTQDQRAERRIKSETEELRAMEDRTKEVQLDLPDMATLEMASQRKNRQSKDIEEEWKAEMQQLEEERLRALREQEAISQQTVESDEALQKVEQEWRSLLAQEEEALKETQREKELLQQREAEERERKEREKRERKENQEELTVEEWIEWMEEKKKAGMTPEQQAEYERRKKLWAVREKEREEKRKREEEERLKKSRERMEAEYKTFRMREQDVREHRLSMSDLEQLQQAQLARDAEERKSREERLRKKFEDQRQRELDEMKPKAKSALAARWEEQVKSRGSNGKDRDYRSTVVSGQSINSNSKVGEREEQRLRKRVYSTDGTSETDKDRRRKSSFQ